MGTKITNQITENFRKSFQSSTKYRQRNHLFTFIMINQQKDDQLSAWLQQQHIAYNSCCELIFTSKHYFMFNSLNRRTSFQSNKFYVSFFNNLLTIWFLALLCELISAWHQRVVALNCYCSCVLYQILLRCPFRCRLFFFERLKRYSAVEKSKRVHSMIKAFVSTSSLLACNLLLLLLATITQHKVIVRKVARALKSFTMVTLTPAAVVASS